MKPTASHRATPKAPPLSASFSASVTDELHRYDEHPLAVRVGSGGRPATVRRPDPFQEGDETDQQVAAAGTRRGDWSVEPRRRWHGAALGSGVRCEWSRRRIASGASDRHAARLGGVR
jgi:hypothetical protein